VSAHESIIDVLAWVQGEQDAWATEKYSPDDEDARTKVLASVARTYGAKHALEKDAGWQLRMSNYLSRALTLGLDSPAGQQALLKFASTAVALVASASRVWPGVMPRAGVPSGEL